MTYTSLIQLSTAAFIKAPYLIESGTVTTVFTTGAKWMFDRLQGMMPDANATFDDQIPYEYYGSLKYGISTGIALAVAILGIVLDFWVAIPLAVIVFYTIEVHFVFLFPLLIDKVKSPIKTSIQHTYRMGLLPPLWTVFRIGMFMIIGLFNPKNRYKNWYIGCLAIVIWYQNEVRTRIQT